MLLLLIAGRGIKIKKKEKEEEEKVNTFQQNGFPLILMSCSLRVSFSQYLIESYESKVQSYQIILLKRKTS